MNNYEVKVNKDDIITVEYIYAVGFLNKDSEIIIEPTYDIGQNFENGIGSVYNLNENKYIAINEDGSRIKKLDKFDEVIFSNGVSRTKYKSDNEDLAYFNIDTEGNLLYDKEKREAKVITNAKDSHTLAYNSISQDEANNERYTFLMNEEGEVLIPEEDKFFYFSGSGKEYIFGYKNFGDNYICKSFKTKEMLENYDVRVAIIDLEGNVVSKWMDYDFDDETLMGRYKYNEYCSDELILIYDTYTEKYGYMSITGDIVIEPQFKYANVFSEGLASVSDGKKYGFIDTTGKLVIPMKYDMLGESKSEMSDDVYLSAYDDRRTVNTGDFGAIFFSQGLCSVNENGKYGFIDKTGNFVIPPQFDAPANFYEDVATCKIGNYYYIIEKIN